MERLGELISVLFPPLEAEPARAPFFLRPPPLGRAVAVANRRHGGFPAGVVAFLPTLPFDPDACLARIRYTDTRAPTAAPSPRFTATTSAPSLPRLSPGNSTAKAS